MQKIALEEHFLTPNRIDHWRTTLVNISPDLGDKALDALTDFGDRRLENMEANSDAIPHPALPQGGFKQSGVGKDLGAEAVDGCLDTKTVLIRYD
jgi:hypothetical protein